MENPKHRYRRPINDANLRLYVSSLCSRNVELGAIICGSCRAAYNRQKRTVPITDAYHTNAYESDPDFEVKSISLKNVTVTSPNVIEICLSSTARSHKYCVVCRNAHIHQLVVVPQGARSQAFVEEGIFVEAKNRCCSLYLNGTYSIKMP